MWLPCRALCRRVRLARPFASAPLVPVLAVAMPPHGELAAPAPHDGNVHREHEQSEWDHPESDDGKETDEAASHKQNAEADTDRLRLGQVKMTVGEADLGGHGRTFGGLFPHRHGGNTPQPVLWPQGRANAGL